MTSDSLHGEVWRVSDLLEHLPATPAGGHRLDDLAASFEALRNSTGTERETVEERIWAIWCDHPELNAKTAMRRSIDLLARRELTDAMAEFANLTERYPAWAEAWNKRATVNFLLGHDAASVNDIYHTLEIEPRHFGALGGFAQICIRNNAADAAHAALKRLLVLNPGTSGIAQAVAAMGDEPPKTMH